MSLSFPQISYFDFLNKTHHNENENVSLCKFSGRKKSKFIIPSEDCALLI